MSRREKISVKGKELNVKVQQILEEKKKEFNQQNRLKTLELKSMAVLSSKI